MGLFPSMSFAAKAVLGREYNLVRLGIVKHALSHEKRMKERMRTAGVILRRASRDNIKGSPLNLGQSKHSSGRSNLLLNTNYIVRKSNRDVSGGLTLLVGQKPRGKAFYGKFLELGTKVRSTKSGKNLGRNRPSGFMAKAWRTKKKRVEQIIGDGLLFGKPSSAESSNE